MTPALGASAVARAETSLRAGALLARDDQGFRWDQYDLELRREVETAGQWLALRFHTYGLDEEIAGILPFDGTEPAVRVGGHLLHDLWWFAVSAGIQGTADLEGAVGEFVIARAIPAGDITFTPTLELAREPLAYTALPLSLGLLSHRAEALLAWRSPQWTGELAGRVELWESDMIPGRAQNPVLDVIEANRIAMVHGYVLSDWEHWFDLGLAAKAAWSEHSTMFLTTLRPAPTYTWYPASAPPFVWETALVLRAAGQLADPLEISLQLQVPLASQETRQWEMLRRTYWGTAPYEGKLQVSWSVVDGTTLHLHALVFAKPWEQWDITAPGTYRQGSLQLSLEQGL